MKSIKATLNLVNEIVAGIRETHDLDIALGGGYAVISHGVGRTTTDVDFYIYTEGVQENSDRLFRLIKQAVPDYFEIKIMEGSKIVDDPFPYDIVFLSDKTGQYPRIDFIIPRYKWELEGIRESKPLEDISFPVLPKPYLIAMKLRAGGPKDRYDIIELYRYLSESEKKKTLELAKLIRRDKMLANLLKQMEPQDKSIDEDLLI